MFQLAQQLLVTSLALFMCYVMSDINRYIASRKTLKAALLYLGGLTLLILILLPAMTVS